jgi:hypothetical protein
MEDNLYAPPNAKVADFASSGSVSLVILFTPERASSWRRNYER